MIQLYFQLHKGGRNESGCKLSLLTNTWKKCLHLLLITKETYKYNNLGIGSKHIP